MTLTTSQKPSFGLVAIVSVGGLLLGAYLFALMWSMTNSDYDMWGGLVIGPVLLLMTLPLARHVAKIEDDPRLVQLIMLALVLKLLASVVRYLVTFDLYSSGDAMVYVREGGLYAEQIRQGNFAYQRGTGGSDGTHFIRQLTGFVFAVTGRTAIGGFMIYAWMSFWGLYLFYRAFKLGVPHGDQRRYAMLVFFLPSLLYWPSSIGKESWMLLTLGIGTYGAARLLTHQRGGYLLLAVGLVGTAAVRPHMTVLLTAGLVVGLLLRRSGAGAPFGALGKLVSGVVVVASLLFAVQAAEEYFDIEGEGVSGAEEVIDRTAEQTAQGGSEFEASRPDSIRDVPSAIFTVMFRPLPHEAQNLQAILTSLEGVFLLLLVGLSWRRLRGLFKEAWRTPYVALASTYSLLFMLAFSSFGNFGILARQRAQLFPFVLTLLALPKISAAVRSAPRPRFSVSGTRADGPGDVEPLAEKSGHEASAHQELIVDLPEGVLPEQEPRRHRSAGKAEAPARDDHPR